MVVCVTSVAQGYLGTDSKCSDFSQSMLVSPAQPSLLFAHMTVEKSRPHLSRSRDAPVKFEAVRSPEQLYVPHVAFPASQRLLSVHTLARESASL